MKQEYITIISKRVKKKIRTADILYIIKSEYLSLIHLIDGDILQTITPIYELKEMLGDNCIEVKKGWVVLCRYPQSRISKIKSICAMAKRLTLP